MDINNLNNNIGADDEDDYGYGGFGWFVFAPEGVWWTAMFLSFAPLLLEGWLAWAEVTNTRFIDMTTYNSEFYYNMVEFIFERSDKLNYVLIDGVQHAKFPLPTNGDGDHVKRVLHYVPTFLFGCPLGINIIYILCNPNDKSHKYKILELSNHIECNRAALTLFFLGNNLPPYKNEAELNAFITFLGRVCTPESIEMLCAISKDLLYKYFKQTGSYTLKDTEFTPSSLHLAQKILERFETPYN